MSTIFKQSNEEKIALLNPTDTTKRIEGFPEICVSTFSRNIIEKYAAMDGVEQIAELVTANGIIPIYKIRYENKEIAFYLSLVGAPACVSCFEEVVAMGAKRFVLFGCCGILDDSVGDRLIIPSAAVRDEGTSYHYITASDEITLERHSVDIIASCMEKCGYSWAEGKCWTTDAIYRETPGIVDQRKQQGCVVVEMECSAMIAAARFREISFAQFLYGADSLDKNKWEINDLMEYGLTDAEKLMGLAFECGIKL